MKTLNFFDGQIVKYKTYVVVFTAGKNPRVTVIWSSFPDISLLLVLQHGSIEDRSYRCWK